EAEKKYGRSLPKPQLPDFPIRGYEYYDYIHDVENVTFVNYQDNATRKAGAISYLLYTSAGISTENSIEGAKFIDAKPVYFPPMERKWGNDNGNGVAWKTAAIHDKDGSVGGVRDSYVLILDGVDDISVAFDEAACEARPDWNAAVCKGDIGRVSFGGPSGGPFGGGRSAGPDGPAGPALATIGQGASGRAAPAPVFLSRNGREYSFNAATVRSGIEVKVTTERPTLNITLSEMDAGSWVIFELPGFTAAASGKARDSLDALRKAGETSYFKDGETLWVKVVSNGNGAGGPRGSGPYPGTTGQISR